MRRLKQVLLSVPLFTLMIMLSGCEELLHNTQSILIPSFHRSDLFGFAAGLGTTFAALPDLISMLRRRSSAGMKPNNGRHHWRVSVSVCLLRPVDRVATSGFVERDRRVH